MAFATRRTSVANPAHRKRRKMTAKQIRHFGTKRQKAALRAKRHIRPRKVSHRLRSSPRPARRNFGELVSLTLGSPMNPASKGKAMAKRRMHHRKNDPGRRPRRRPSAHNARRNPAHRMRTRPVHHYRRHHNPMGTGWGAQITSALYIIAGAVGSKLGAQAVLGTKNTGFLGYGTNLAVGGVLAWIAKGVLKNAQAAREVFAGSVVQVVLRLIADYTPFGQYTSQLGMGDYLVSNWVAPQRYTDALHSAQVQIPAGWAPTTVIQSAAPPVASGGMGGLYEGGASLY